MRATQKSIQAAKTVFADTAEIIQRLIASDFVAGEGIGERIKGLAHNQIESTCSNSRGDDGRPVRRF